MPFADQQDGVELRLRRYLGSRLAPLAVLLVVVTCLSAPLAFFVLGRNNLELRSTTTAADIADLIGRDAQERPRLWRYDSSKLLNHVRGYELQPGIEAVEVVDLQGARIDPNAADLSTLRSLDAIWRSAPIEANHEPVGEVWVAVSVVGLERDTLVLLMGFALLGTVLGGLMYIIPMRAMSRAQAEIGGLLSRLAESQAALAKLNESLEQQVESRSAELRAAYAELQESERSLRQISARAVKLQESERRGIARELHDSAGQALTAIRIHLQLMGELVDSGAPDEKVVELARRTTSMVDTTVEEIRRAVNQLGPAVLDDVGLEAALSRLADDLHDNTGLDVDCAVTLSQRLDASLETTCYRIVQESLTNVTRHADASHVHIEAHSEGDQLEILVRDDGRGFAPDESTPRSRGLVGMRERVALLGGTLTISSEVGRGTEVSASLPIVDEPETDA